MLAPVKLNFKVYQGSTFREVFRWESSEKVYVPIAQIQRSAPCLVETSVAHNLPNNWRFRVTGAGGMREINSQIDQWYQAKVLSATLVEINQINSSGYAAYTSGGVLEYNKPVNLLGYVARMQIRPKLDSDVVLATLTTENGGIVLDTSLSSITVNLTAQQTQQFNFQQGVYSLELDQSGVVVPFCTGNIMLVKEVTR